MYTPLSQQSQSGLTMLFRHRVGTGQGNVLVCNSTGNTLLQLSRLFRLLLADPSVKNGIGVRKLITTKKKERKEEKIEKQSAGKEGFVEPSPPPLHLQSSDVRKRPPAVYVMWQTPEAGMYNGTPLLPRPPVKPSKSSPKRKERWCLKGELLGQGIAHTAV